MSERLGLCLRVSAILACLVLPLSTAWAADTYEVYDQGAAEFELYLGGDGLNLDEYEKTVWAEALAGYGLLPALSGYLGLAVESNEYLVGGSGGFCFGLFGTPLDTDHVDLDLLLDVSLAGEGLTELGATPGLELNFDLKPDQELWGVYLRVEEYVYGRDVSTADNPRTPDVDEGEVEQELVPTTGLTAGSYFTIGERHQILVEYDHALRHNAAEDERESEIGGVALGYNVMLQDTLELANQVYFDIPQGEDDLIEEEDFGWGLSIGIVAAIP